MFFPLSETFIKLVPSLTVNCMLSKFVADDEDKSKINGEVVGAAILSMKDILMNRDKIDRININLKANNYLQNIQDAYSKLDVFNVDDGVNTIKAKTYFVNNSYYLNRDNVIIYAPIYIDSIKDIPTQFFIDITIKNSESYKLYYIHKLMYINIGLLRSYLINYLLNTGFDNNVLNIQKTAYDKYSVDIFGIGLKSGIFETKTIDYNIDSETELNEIHVINERLASLFAYNHVALKTVLPLSFSFNINNILNANEKFEYRNCHYLVKSYYITNNQCHINRYTIQQYYNKNILSNVSYKTSKINYNYINIPYENDEKLIFFKHKNSSNYVLNFASMLNNVNYQNLFNSLSYNPKDTDSVLQKTKISNILVNLFNYQNRYYSVDSCKTMIFNNIFNLKNLLLQYRTYVQYKYIDTLSNIENETGVNYKEIYDLVEQLQQLKEYIYSKSTGEDKQDLITTNNIIKQYNEYFGDIGKDLINRLNYINNITYIDSDNNEHKVSKEAYAENIINVLVDLKNEQYNSNTINIFNQYFNQFMDLIQYYYYHHFLIHDRLQIDNAVSNPYNLNRKQITNEDLEQIDKFYIRFIYH